MRARLSLFSALAAIAAAAACSSSGSGGGSPVDDAASPDAPDAARIDAGRLDAGDAGSCTRDAAPADRPRKVVVSHPFGAAGVKAKAFEVLDLAANGTLTRPNPPVTFEMGAALGSAIVFTPDGELGLVAQDDGSVGVFRLTAAGAAIVIEPAFAHGFFARAVTVAADGSRAWVLDPNAAASGGGVYELAIGCDGSISSRGLVVPGGNANAMALLPGDPGKAVLAARGAFDSPSGADVHVVDLLARSRVASGAPFGDTNAIPSSVAVTPDGKYALVADDGVLAGNRVAVADLAGGAAPVSLLTTPYPASVVMSPFGNAAIVLNDDSSDQIHVLAYDATNATAPFTIKGELAYKFGKPEIPVTASTIDRGALRGTVFIGEHVAVRQLTFTAAGGVDDAAKLVFPGGSPGMVGVVGVQP